MRVSSLSPAPIVKTGASVVAILSQSTFESEMRKKIEKLAKDKNIIV